MSKVIQVKNLSKKYDLFHEGHSGYSTLVDTLTSTAKKAFKSIRHPFSKSSKTIDNSHEEFWALKDISFDIEEGDRVGIIGRNGAGKSTLLKILSRITEPTAGQVKMRGRLSCLLEVSTGFHPELTGRENIYLNGAILGIKKNEIKRKFDDIVSFAEIEQFLDTPVKRYSSGMYMRLGFAIAAHLDSDLLIIDEVLAVGDSQFQAKCFKKLNDLGSIGKTVIFVSHDIGSVLSLCNKGVYLEKGQIKESGPIDTCVNAYMKNFRERSFQWEGIVGDEHIRFYKAQLDGEREFFYHNDKPCLNIDYEILKPNPDLVLSIGIWNMRNQLLARSQTFDTQESYQMFSKPGRHQLSFNIDASLFHEGEYLIKLHCHIYNQKSISDDDIVLKLPIYKQQKNTRFSNTREGIHLGNHWNWQKQQQ